jgi:hypothetical protein
VFGVGAGVFGVGVGVFGVGAGVFGVGAGVFGVGAESPLAPPTPLVVARTTTAPASSTHTHRMT